METQVSFNRRVTTAAVLRLVVLPGVLFASPLIAVLMVVVEELYVRDRLEKDRR